MVLMIDINAKAFELFDQEFNFVLFRVPSHVSKLFVLVACDDFVNGTR